MIIQCYHIWHFPQKQSNMRIGLVILSALVVLAFVDEASADPRELAEDRHPPVVHYDSLADCQADQNQECWQLVPGVWFATNTWRDDLEAAVSKNESIIY